MDKFQLENIKQGLINQSKSILGILEEEIKLLADARMNICNSCPNKSEFNSCKLCGCFLPLKTKSVNASCDEKKW
jgi:hypothetical protein